MGSSSVYRNTGLCFQIIIQNNRKQIHDVSFKKKFQRSELYDKIVFIWFK